MRSEAPRGKNREFEKPANWDEAFLGPCGSLPLRLDFYPDGEFVPGKTIVRCTSAWRPTPAELAILNHGGVVEITLCGLQPPMMVKAVESPTPLEEAPHDAANAGSGLTINEDGHGMGYDEHGPSTP